jgi:error-prone DNA polymerase
MGSRLILITGKVQRSEDNVVHLISEKLIDRTYDLDRLSEDETKLPPGHLEDIQFPRPDSRASLHRHPRNVRVLPKSRDFH